MCWHIRAARHVAATNLRGIKIGQKVDCVGVQVTKKGGRSKVLQAALCIPHGSWWIAINRPKVTMTINLQQAAKHIEF